MNEFSVIEAIKIVLACSVGLAVACGAVLILPESEQKVVVKTVFGGGVALAAAMWVVWPSSTRDVDAMTIVKHLICLVVMAQAIKWALDPSMDESRVNPPSEPKREST
jgi:RsiW-degrading membrane proteinase PrsW (M82 family)